MDVQKTTWNEKLMWSEWKIKQAVEKWPNFLEKKKNFLEFFLFLREEKKSRKNSDIYFFKGIFQERRNEFRPQWINSNLCQENSRKCHFATLLGNWFLFCFSFWKWPKFSIFFLCKKFFLMFYFVFKNTRNFPEKEIRSQKLRGFWYFEQKENTWYFLKDKKYFIPLNILLLYSHNLESNFGKDYRTNPKILL